MKDRSKAGPAKVRVLRPVSPRPREPRARLGSGGSSQRQSGGQLGGPAGDGVLRGPMRFDGGAARQAWRQVARVRGAGPGIGAERPRRFAFGWWVGFAVLAVGVVWLGRDPDPRDGETSSSGVVAGAPAADENKARKTKSGRNDADSKQRLAMARAGDDSEHHPTLGSSRESRLVPRPREPLPPVPEADVVVSPEARPEASSPIATPVPEAPARSEGPADDRAAVAVAPGIVEPVPVSRPVPFRLGIRVVPPGTRDAAARAFQRIPKARTDRAPLGGISGTGLHVDRFSVGADFDRGVCRGATNDFSLTTHDYVNFCFRVVHQRTPEYVLVKWEQGGRLVRRAWVRIPADHAYRTRAGLPLRAAFGGKWTVRVVSGTGVELVSHTFRVVP